MPCYRPIQGFMSTSLDGSRRFVPSNVNGKLFFEGKPMIDLDGTSCTIPCGSCEGCRLERSRQWGVRCIHEAKLYDDNCFVTLTFAPEFLDRLCPGGSLSKKHIQDFMKRLRKRFSDRKIRVFYCGEYGEKFSRPHYHLCLFNFDFADKRRFQRVNGNWYYVSDILSDLWPFGYSAIGELTFESASYVARYVVKKQFGRDTSMHYQGRLPEFCGMSLKPGIGYGFYKMFKKDVYPSDEVIVRGRRCKPPRYYDKLLQQEDPALFEDIRNRRLLLAEERSDDSTFKRLAVREKCNRARIKSLIRTLEIL